VITTAPDGIGRCGLWSRPQRGQGEGKGAEEQAGVGVGVGSRTLTIANIAWDGARTRNLRVLCVRVRCCQGKWWAKPHTLLVSPTHPYGRKETEANTETTNRQVKQAG
jgi:hypothetical protein